MPPAPKPDSGDTVRDSSRLVAHSRALGCVGLALKIPQLAATRRRQLGDDNWTMAADQCNYSHVIFRSASRPLYLLLAALVALAVVAISMVLPAVGSATKEPIERAAVAPKFGTIDGFGWREEHMRITMAALSCDTQFETDSKPDPCFATNTLSNLAGARNAWGGVGAADNLSVHFSGGPDWWHCDGADYFNKPSYPRTRGQATKKLDECRNFAQAMLGDGLGAGSSIDPNCRSNQNKGLLTYRCEGVVEVAHKMLPLDEISQPGWAGPLSGCSFNGAFTRKSRTKCLILQQFGYALHTIQDFYAHSNFTDLIPAGQGGSVTTPPGVGGSAPSPYWDLTKHHAPSWSSGLGEDITTGCYPDSDCVKEGRITHANLNKDKGLIDRIYGSATDPLTTRGQMTVRGVTNFSRAAQGAIRQTREAWKNLQSMIAHRGGNYNDARRIVCAIASDTPKDC